MQEDKDQDQDFPNNNSFYMDIITQIVSKKKKPSLDKEAEVKKLYETVNLVVSDLDVSIRDCKKYNEAKIHRKYQILIADLRKRISFLEEKIKEEQRARSPSKRYVQDLLDKLIKYKFENQSLNKRIEELTADNEEMRKKIKIYQEDGQGVQDGKESEKKLNPEKEATMEITGAVLKNQINAFVKLKQNLRHHEKIEKTSFERFLKKIQDKLENWSMRQFLQSVEKWTLDFYENDFKKYDIAKSPPQTVNSSHLTKTNHGLKPSSITFRLRSKKAISSAQVNKNLTMYENILR